MTPTETTTFLRRYNEWRRTDDRHGLPYPDPREIGAAIDAAIEMIDRLEAAEKSDAESLAMYRKARDERDALRAALRHEADCVEAAKAEIDALRAELDALKRQEPYAFAVNFPESSRVELVHDLDEAYEDMIYEAYEVRKLYLAPGAKGE